MNSINIKILKKNKTGNLGSEKLNNPNENSVEKAYFIEQNKLKIKISETEDKEEELDQSVKDNKKILCTGKVHNDMY
jgi:hypothetical protein